MLKKCAISFILVAFLNFVGCYSSEIITKTEVDQGTKQLDFNQEITISTRDYNSYSFGAHQYQIQNDTLNGTGITTKLGKEVPFKGKIAMDDILSFEQSTMDAGSTIGLVVGIIAAGALILGIIFTVAISDAFNPD